METHDNAMPLCEMPIGSAGVARRIMGGREFSRRAATLGLTPGADLKVLQNHGSGPILILVRGARLALGRGEAAKVIVEPIPAEGDPRG